MSELNRNLWTKASMVANGINKLIWAHTYFYIYPHIDEDLREDNVYLNNCGKFSVRLEDGSEFFLIQPCPHLIYQLYEAKSRSNNGDTIDGDTIRMAKAYEKFERFFEHMISYCSINIVG